MADLDLQCSSIWIDNGYDERCERTVGLDGEHPGFHQMRSTLPSGIERTSVWGELSHWTLPVSTECPRCGTYTWPATVTLNGQCRHCDAIDAVAEKTRRP